MEHCSLDLIPSFVMDDGVEKDIHCRCFMRREWLHELQVRHLLQFELTVEFVLQNLRDHLYDAHARRNGIPRKVRLVDGMIGMQFYADSLSLADYGEHLINQFHLGSL